MIIKLHLREFFWVFSVPPGDDMAVRNKQVKRNPALVKWKLQLPSSSSDVHLHWCRTKTFARRLLFQSSGTATGSFRWATRTQMQLHTHGYFNSAPPQNLSTSSQQLGSTRNAGMYLGRYHMLLSRGVLQRLKSSQRDIIWWHAATACVYLAESWKRLKTIQEQGERYRWVPNSFSY